MCKMTLSLSQQRRLRWIAFTALVLAPSARAADPQPYTVELAKTGNAVLDKALADSSTMIALRTQVPVGSFALVARAQTDTQRFITALHSFGYYNGTVSVRIAGHPLDDVGLPDLIEAAPAAPPVAVTVAITPGPLFHLRQVGIDGAVPPDVAKSLAPLKAGSPAVAAALLAARSRLLAALKAASHPLATVAEPLAVEVAGETELDVSYPVDQGPRADLGPITLEGLGRVNEDYVRQRLLLHQGEPYSPDAIEKARTDLSNIGVFSAVRVVEPTALDPAGQLPLTIDFTERPRHLVGFNALYSTDLGASAGVTWSDRNVFGNAEQLNLKASITQIGGTAVSRPGYDVGAQFLKPDWLARDQTLEFDLEGLEQTLPAYSRTAVIASTVVTRKLSPHWTVSLGGTATQERVLQEGQTYDYTLLGVPGTVRYDNTDSSFDPTMGVRAAATVTPTQGFGKTSDSFVVTNLSASTYLDVGKWVGGTPGRSIVALRAVGAEVPGTTALKLPPDERFYAGGSGTVRGFTYQSVGPRFPDRIPVGGTELLAGTVELRQRFLESFGVAAFVDAGEVSGAGKIAGVSAGGTLAVGAGVGARYFTAFGPIRLDVAVPLTQIRGDQVFQLYIGLGQAF